MATQLAQRTSTLGSTAAAQKRAAAPRAPFSSPVLAQLKQVRIDVKRGGGFRTGQPRIALNRGPCIHAECQGHLSSPAVCYSALCEGTGT